MPVLCITDCDDTNSRIRFAARIASLFGCQPEIIGLTGDHHGNHKDCEAAGQLVDTIAALDGASAIIITNHAPRNGEYKEENGAPFCFFWVKATLVITTIGGHILSLVKKLHLAETITVLHLDATVRLMQNHGAVNADDAKELLITQFRSLLFAPLAAKSLHEGRIRSGECLPLSKVPDIPPHTIWFVDAFGNRKLTTTWEEVGWKEGDHIATDISQASIPFIERLTDVPVGTIAFTVGSSGGRGKKHFIELVMNGGDPAVYLGHPLEIGKTITAQAMKKKKRREPMVIPNGTRDALSALADLAVREGRNIPPRWLDPTQKDFRPDIIGRRGSAVDGGETGRLVLLGATRQDGSEIAVRWCNTGEPILPFTKLD